MNDYYRHIWFDGLKVGVPVDGLVEVTVGKCNVLSSGRLHFETNGVWTKCTIVKKDDYIVLVKVYKNNSIGITEDKIYAYCKDLMPIMIKRY